MAKARVELTCAECGESFEISKTCNNRTEADNWEDYMSGRTNLICSDCYYKAKKAEREAEKQKFVEEVYSKLNLPQIEGVSEKQVKFAEDLRIKFIYNRKRFPMSTIKEMHTFLMQESSARKIIDTLKELCYGLD